MHVQGMVDPGDTVSRTLRKEFGEEAMNTLEASPEEKKQIERQINELFKGGHKVTERERERNYCSIFSMTVITTAKVVPMLFCVWLTI